MTEFNFCSILQIIDSKFSFYCFIVASQLFWKFIYTDIIVFKSDLFGFFFLVSKQMPSFYLYQLFHGIVSHMFRKVKPS